MIAPDAIIAKLKDLLPDGTLRAVDGAGGLPDVIDQAKTTRAAYVLGGDETADANAFGTMTTIQQVTATFSVFLIFTAKDATGRKALNDVVPVRDAVKAKLTGWQPEGESTPIQYRNGKVVDIDLKAGVIVYQCNFYNSYTLRA